MKVVLHIVCNVATNSDHKIVLDIDDKIWEDYDISDYDELCDLLDDKTEQYYEYEGEGE